MKIAIVYGLFEGPLHGKKLERELKRRLHTVVKSQSNADVIIAHSGGCLLIENTDARIVCIDPPTRTGSVLKNVVHHVMYDLVHVALRRPFVYTYKTAANMFYMTLHIPTIIKMYRRLDDDAFHVWHKSTTKTFTSDDGSWTDDSKIKVHERVSGDHDRIWHDPKAYLDLLKL